MLAPAASANASPKLFLSAPPLGMATVADAGLDADDGVAVPSEVEVAIPVSDVAEEDGAVAIV